jgi:hypothetical protein
MRRRHPESWRLLIVHLIICAGLSLLLMRTVMTRGLDLTDESYYLLWLQEPSAYTLSPTLFGFQLHPLYLVLGGSVTLLRTVGAMTLMLCGGWAAYAFMRSIDPDTRPRSPQLAALVIVAGFAQLLYYVLWLPTPSYNLLTVFAGLILCISLAILASDAHWSPARGGAAAATAGTLAFVAKPICGPTFALIFALGLLVVAKDWRAVRHATTSAFIVTMILLLVSVLLIGGPYETWMMIDNYFDVFGLASPAGQSLGSSLNALLHRAEGQGLAVAAAAMLLGAWRVPLAQRPIWLGATGVGVLSAASLLQGGWALYQAPLHYGVIGPLLASMVLSALGFAFLFHRDSSEARWWRAVLIASTVPWAIAYGTSNDLAQHTSLGSGIDAMLLLLIAHRFASGRREVFPLAVVSVLALTGGGLWRALSLPYRLDGPIWTQTSAVTIGNEHATVLVSPHMQHFIDDLLSVAAGEGLRSRTPILDLTGESPGISYILGARPLGTPWLLGGYPFSERVARWIISHTDRERMASAWILSGDGPVAFRPDFTDSVELDLANNYDLVAEMVHPVGKWTMRLYAPKLRHIALPAPTR